MDDEINLICISMIRNIKLLLKNSGYPQMSFINTDEDLILFDSLENKNITEEEFKKMANIK